MGKDNQPEREDVGYIYGPNGNKLEKLEGISRANPVIASEEADINSAKTFIVNKYWSAVADAATNNIAITTSDDVFIHLKAIQPYTTGSIGELQVQRGAAISGGSSVSDIPNLNGSSEAGSPNAAVSHGVSIGTAGDDMFVPDAKLFGSDTDKKQGPLGLINLGTKMIAPANDTIVIHLTNSAGAQVDYIGVTLLWSEMDIGYSARF